MQNTFEKWLQDNNKSLRHASIMQTISNDLQKVHYVDYDIFSISSLYQAERVKEDYFNFNEFYDKNERGHNMYNSAFNRYLEFLESEESNEADTKSPNAFFENGVLKEYYEEARFNKIKHFKPVDPFYQGEYKYKVLEKFNKIIFQVF